MRAASSADKLMVSHKAGHELLLLLLLLPLTDKQTGPHLLAPHIHYAAIAVVALDAALQHCVLCVCVAASLAACSSCQPVN